jgi:hypothetical protein
MAGGAWCRREGLAPRPGPDRLLDGTGHPRRIDVDEEKPVVSAPPDERRPRALEVRDRERAEPSGRAGLRERTERDREGRGAVVARALEARCRLEEMTPRVDGQHATNLGETVELTG